MPPLFLLGARYHQNKLVTGILIVPMVIWFFLPLGAAYGIYVGMAQGRRRESGMLALFGVLANSVYLLVAVLIWIAVFSGVLSA